jgi:hypothetical protein
MEGEDSLSLSGSYYMITFLFLFSSHLFTSKDSQQQLPLHDVPRRHLVPAHLLLERATERERER